MPQDQPMIYCHFCKKDTPVKGFGEHLKKHVNLENEKREKMHVLKIRFKDALYDTKRRDLVLPVRLVTDALDMQAYMHIPCSESLHKALLEGLKEELSKDGRICHIIGCGRREKRRF